MDYIYWEAPRPVQEQFLWWTLDSYEEQRGWRYGRLEYLLRIYRDGTIELRSALSHYTAGVFIDQDSARNWANTHAT